MLQKNGDEEHLCSGSEGLFWVFGASSQASAEEKSALVFIFEVTDWNLKLVSCGQRKLVTTHIYTQMCMLLVVKDMLI